MKAGELNVKKEMIYQILHEEDVSKVHPTQTHGAGETTENRVTPRLHPDLSIQFQFS
jgi:hypothetical protein